MRLCIAGLERMRLSETRAFSASYRMENGRPVNVRSPRLEYKYSMNTFMGLHRARRAGAEVPFDIEGDFHELADKVDRDYVDAEDVAATIWAAGALEVDPPEKALSAFRAILDFESSWSEMTAQSIAWCVFGCLALGDEGAAKARALARLALDRFVDRRTHLVRHRASGWRSDWASFAASCYTSYALLTLGRVLNDDDARGEGLAIARRLVELQGPLGQWAWFYDVPRGRVVDFYQVYAVHQEAMAPFFLLEAIDQGHEEFRAPLAKGFRWILGENEIGRSMVSREHSLVWRSLVRVESMEKARRFARGLGSKHLGRSGGTVGGGRLRVNHECRSYELGWALWAFRESRCFDRVAVHRQTRKRR